MADQSPSQLESELSKPRTKTMQRPPTVEDLRAEMQMDDHMIPMEELVTRLDVDLTQGLSVQEASIRLVIKGRNCLTPPKKAPAIWTFLREMFGGFGPLMLAGAFLSLIVYFIQAGVGDAPMDNVYVFVVLIIVLLLTTSFSIYQKHRSEKIMDSFKKMIPETATVLRSGNWIPIAAEELVVGDIVEVRGGDRIPADLRIINVQSFKVDNSSLTGESEPQQRTTKCNPDPLLSRNLCFYTTNAVEGSCEAIVIRTGDRTVMGRIAKLTANMEDQPTPIAREIAHCVLIISAIALLMGVIYVLVAYLVQVDWVDIISLSIGLMVGNMPAGLLIMVTAMLALTAKRMAARNCLIKNLEAVESLGSCSVICSDKTGTLTQNKMTVSSVWVDNTFLPLCISDNPKDLKIPESSSSMIALLQIAGLCNRAKFRPGEKSKPILKRKVDGDASESAILKFVELTTGCAADYRKFNPVMAEIPFNSTNKFQLSIHETTNGEYILVMKGAPEVILSHCATLLINGEQMSLGLPLREKVIDACMDFAKRGERVIAFCDLTLPKEKFPVPYPFDTESLNFPLDGLRFVGLISLIDPPRATVPDAISKCRIAGIRVMMVTGDHPVTAVAIARSVGIISPDSFTAEEIAAQREIQVKDVDPLHCRACVILGDQLKEMSDCQLEAVLKNHPELVFARTSPHQKLRIVEACQRLGAVVGVTGDGVNDSPALRKADIGIAMGITGSDVSKQAADMILLDDNFSSIVSGVEEGRLIFDNIKKTCCYAMTTDIPEIAPVLMYIILNIPLGLYTIPMLLLNCATDLMPAISLAYESAESDIMKLPPRKPKERLISSNLVQAVYLQIGMIESLGAFLVYFAIYAACGWWPGKLLGIRTNWEDSSIQDLTDSYGQEWNYAQRKYLERLGNSGFFLATVIQNVMHLLVRRCRRESLFQKGFRNYRLLFAIIFESALACAFVYIPGLHDVLAFTKITPLLVFPVLPFLLYVLCYDEMRRFLVLKFPKTWIEHNLYV